MDIDEKYNAFYKRVIKTRESRIRASERLANRDQHYQVVQLIYAIFFLALSIWIFYLEKIGRMVSSADASTILLICSFSITGTSFYVNSKNYKERSLQLKSNYIALCKLLYDIEATQCQQHSNETLIIHYQEHYGRYMILLENVENHSTFDYLCTLRDRGESFTRYEWSKFIWWSIEIRLLSWVISITPLALTCWFIFA
ncbi:SLATT domain-containing protein [Pelosinus propionicus]|uniref:SMODS and SLOG-associating 2TM effector domain-containing protein n=1 Tax=Pelosinus propionicus DSM 13327 TaxID=1123291 RepID=A0A1I4HNM4_9FIRM|nr:SLATT domain-containing protein [Pelosinus propionicus]SFL43829.1 hypothetical protein SAMN04490355_1004140 [Pelosinus propionicus DSM 13327]